MYKNSPNISNRVLYFYDLLVLNIEKNKISKATIMEQFAELLPVFGFVLSLGLFGYGLKKILIKVENDI